MLAYTTIVSGASPSIVYASPDNGDTFVDVWRGKGVNVTVNVSDGDGDLNQVVLKWNNSGTWDTFYDSGALGGVSYHNHTVLNTNFTGSWETYEYQICAYDTAWTNVTYSFTTGYVWGDQVMVTFDDNIDYTSSLIYKNNTNDYYLLYCSGSNIYAKLNTYSTNWVSKSSTSVSSDDFLYHCAVTYNTDKYFFSSSAFNREDNEALRYIKYSGSWSSGSTGITTAYDGGTVDTWARGADCIYYNGQWMLFSGNAGFKYYALTAYTGTPPNNWNSLTNVDYHGNQPTGNNGHDYYVSTDILDGYLIIVYYDVGNDLHWKTYDGVSWVDKGNIETDISSYGCSVVKDPVNNQLVCVYIASDGKMYYRTLTDPSGSWSSKHLLFQPASGKTIKYPHVSYIDHRLVVTFAYNMRGNYNIYMISAPDYMSEAHGVLQQYNRIQFPDATPNQQHVNSSVFYFKNIGSRAITEINITFADIGSIQCENNFKLWGSTDNSSWTDLGTTNATGVLGPINSVTWATGMNWGSGEIRYFKLEILDIGSVVEDLHACDESIIWEITLE